MPVVASPALRALDAELVADFAGADEQALRVCDAGFRQDVLEVRHGKGPRWGDIASGWRSMLLGVKTMSGLRQERQRLTAQQMEILRGGGGLADLNIVVRGELEVALDAGAGVLRALAFVAVGQQQGEAAEQAPLVFAGGDELVDDDLRAVGEVAELRFPEDEGFGVVAAVAILEAQHAGLGEDRVVDAEARLIRIDVVERESRAARFRCR